MQKKYKIGVVLTSFTKGNKQPQNSAFVINKSGDILIKYSKVHTCDFADERNVESGKEFRVCDLEGIKLGIAREFNEENDAGLYVDGPDQELWSCVTAYFRNLL